MAWGLGSPQTHTTGLCAQQLPMAPSEGLSVSAETHNINCLIALFRAFKGQ